MKRRFYAAIAFALLVPLPAAAQTREVPPEPGFAEFLFPPELVMQNQKQLGLRPEQRGAITGAIKELQGKVLDIQWKMEEENQRLAELLQSSSVDSAAALEQIDRILNLERAIKRAHLALLIRIKNTLTQPQQAMLLELRRRSAAQDPGGQ
jgi:Spy/CpxP family protein refolding chaperone